jgi:hypothetical protein
MDTKRKIGLALVIAGVAGGVLYYFLVIKKKKTTSVEPSNTGTTSTVQLNTKPSATVIDVRAQPSRTLSGGSRSTGGTGSTQTSRTQTSNTTPNATAQKIT